MARFEDHAGRYEDGLVTGAADLEEDETLVLELDLLVVDPPGLNHRPECARERSSTTERCQGGGIARGFKTVAVADGSLTLHARSAPLQPPPSTC